MRSPLPAATIMAPVLLLVFIITSHFILFLLSSALRPFDRFSCAVASGQEGERKKYNAAHSELVELSGAELLTVAIAIDISVL
jgi:hypothetical protein